MRKILITLLLCFFVSEAYPQIIKKGRGNYDYNGNLIEQKEAPPFQFVKQSMFSMSIADLVFTNLTFKYQFFRKDGMVGYEIPFSFNAGGVPDTSPYQVRNAGRFLSAKNRIFQSGINLNYYFNGQDKVSPFVGVGLGIGWFNYWQYNYTYTNNPYGYPNQTLTSHEKQIGGYYNMAFNAGILFNPKERLTFSVKAGLGLRRYATNFIEYTFPFFTSDVSVGFKF